MDAVFELARRYGVDVRYEDLGEWGAHELRSEYDPQGPVIRVNKRVIERLPAVQTGEFIAFCVAHELYHHREHRGEVARLGDRVSREAAANDFARSLVGRNPLDS